MTQEERKDIIDFIISSDGTYDYSAVNFKFYSDDELIALKEKIEEDIKNRKEKDRDGLPMLTL